MSKSTKQTTENKPPAWAAPLFSKSAGIASNLYDSGKGGGVYEGKTVADLGGTTQSAIGLAGQQPAASNYLQDYASGKYLQEGNPYYRQRLNNEIADSNALIQSQFAGAGRYGSGANTGVLAKNTQNMLLQGLENDYNRAQGNQLQAVGMIDSANDTAFQNRLQAGALQDANQQQKLTSEYAKWMANDMKDWTRLGLLQSAAAGSAGNYGTNVQTMTQPMNPLGILGGIGSLFAKSDARLKTDIEPVGYAKGHILWEFCYRGSPERFRGVMAQMVDDPEAVVMEEDGFYAVNYARLGLEMERV